MKTDKKKLIAFSGLAWNLKSTILDKYQKDHITDVIRLVQTNKATLTKKPDATPEELWEVFMTTNNQVLAASPCSVAVTDRYLFDYFIYDLMMNPIYAWQQMVFSSCVTDSAVINSIKSPMYYNLLEDLENNYDEVLIMSLETANYKFIEQTFEKQPESSTSYLFDNLDKYVYYSNLFNNLSDKLFNILSEDLKTTKLKRLHFKFTESMTPDEFIQRVCNEL